VSKTLGAVRFTWCTIGCNFWWWLWLLLLY